MPAWLMTLLGPAKRMVQLGAVALNPAFALVRNPFRDAFTRPVYTQSTKFVTPLSSIQGVWYQLIKHPDYLRWKAGGGELTTIMGQDRLAARRRISEALARGFLEKGTQIVRHPIDALRVFFGMFESAPRIMEFSDVYAQAEAKYGKGSWDAWVAARNASKEATVDFTRAGIISQALNQAIPFFNPRIQGASKFYRTFIHKPGRTALRASTAAFMWLTVPSLLLWWLVKDDDEWKELPSWRKWGFWNIPRKWFGGDSGFISLTLPFELGYVFGGVPAAAMDSFYRSDPKSVNDAMLMAFKAFLPGDSPVDLLTALGKPVVEAWTNYDSFRGRHIVSPYDAEQRLSSDQYNRWTTETSKAIGEVLGVSPALVDHVLSGYTGGLGLRIVQRTEAIAGVRKSAGKREAADIPVVGTLFTRSPYGRGESVDRFYDRREELTRLAGSKRATVEQRVELHRLNKAARAISTLRKWIDDGKLGEDDGLLRINKIAKKALSLPGTTSVEDEEVRANIKALQEARQPALTP